LAKKYTCTHSASVSSDFIWRYTNVVVIIIITIKQEHVKGADSTKANRARIQNFHDNSISFSSDMSQTMKNALSRNVEESFTKFLDSDPHPNDFHNLIRFSLSNDTSLARFTRKSDQ